MIEAAGLEHVPPKLEHGPDPTGLLPMQQAYQMCALGGHLITTSIIRGDLVLPGKLFTIGGVTHHGGQAGGCSPMRDIPRFVEMLEKGQLRREDARDDRRADRADARGLRRSRVPHDDHGDDDGVRPAHALESSSSARNV